MRLFHRQSTVYAVYVCFACKEIAATCKSDEFFIVLLQHLMISYTESITYWAMNAIRKGNFGWNSHTFWIFLVALQNSFLWAINYNQYQNRNDNSSCSNARAHTRYSIFFSFRSNLNEAHNVLASDRHWLKMAPKRNDFSINTIDANAKSWKKSNPIHNLRRTFVEYKKWLDDGKPDKKWKKPKRTKNEQQRKPREKKISFQNDRIQRAIERLFIDIEW